MILQNPTLKQWHHYCFCNLPSKPDIIKEAKSRNFNLYLSTYAKKERMSILSVDPPSAMVDGKFRFVKAYYHFFFPVNSSYGVFYSWLFTINNQRIESDKSQKNKKKHIIFDLLTKFAHIEFPIQLHVNKLLSWSPIISSKDKKNYEQFLHKNSLTVF